MNRKAIPLRGEEVIARLEARVQNGSAEAAFALAEAYQWGYLTEEDPARAERLYRRLCRSKSPAVASRGFYRLGLLYYYGYRNKGESPEAGLSFAFACFMKSAIKFPNPPALCRLGDMYRYGQYVEKNEAVACELYLKARRGG